MKVLASDSKLTQFTVDDGAARHRSQDGTFHVPDALGRSMVKSSEWATVGTSFRNVQGYECLDCGRVNVFRDRCGKCGSTNLRQEDE